MRIYLTVKVEPSKEEVWFSLASSYPQAIKDQQWYEYTLGLSASILSPAQSQIQSPFVMREG